MTRAVFFSWGGHGQFNRLHNEKWPVKSGNKEELKAVQKELRRKIREGKNNYRRKMENQLQQRNLNGVWESLNPISGQRTPDSQAAGDQTWVNDRNLFCNKFDQTSFIHHLTVLARTLL